MHTAWTKLAAPGHTWKRMLAVGVAAGVVILPMSAIHAAPSLSAHALPGTNITGVTRLCGPDPGYGCTAGGYAGQSTGWSGTKYGAAFSSRNANGYHNCTLYVAYRLQMNGAADPGWSDNAIAWDSTAAAHGVPVNQTPAVGAAAQWNGSTGHVAYVDVVTSTYIEVSSDNFGANYTERFRIAVGSRAWPDNFVHVHDVGAAGALAPDGTTIAVGSHASGEIDVFWRGSTGTLVESYYAQGRWWGPLNLGMGTLGSAPSVAVQSNGEVDVFWRGANGRLWEAFYSGGRWHGPLDLGFGQLSSAPAVAASGTDLAVYWRGTDGKLWQTRWTQHAWRAPVALPMGVLGSAPAAAARPDGTQYVYWRGGDGNLWQAAYVNGAWHGPTNVGMGPLASAPTVNARYNGEIDVFWRAANGGLREAFWLGRWYGPLALYGPGVDSAPASIARSRDVDVFWRAADSIMRQAWYSNGRWYGPELVTAAGVPASG